MEDSAEGQSRAPAYRRVLVKLSGELLAGGQEMGIQPEVIGRLATELRDVSRMGVQVGVVIGGGNIFRGVAGASRGMDRAQADTMGMLATVINGLALQDALEKAGCDTRLQTAIAMRQVTEPYIRRKAMRHMEKGRVVIFSAGTGNPYFSTDTAAALRATEIHADVLLKVTKVDGVFDKDPVLDPDATIYREITAAEVIERRLRVMDSTAVLLCLENNMPIVVFNGLVSGNLARVVRGEELGTRVLPQG